MPPWLDRRVLHRAGGLLVVDKPPNVPASGEPHAAVERLGAWLDRHGSPGSVRAHEELDRRVSGVLTLSEGGERGEQVGRALAAPGAERRYVAVARGALPDSGTLSGRAGHFRIVRRAGARAFIEIDAARSVAEIRAQLANRGAPISGDTTHGGEPAPRLMLHARSLELPGESGGHFEAPIPEALTDWVDSGALLIGGEGRIRRAIEDAAVRRWALDESTTALRLVDDADDELPGIVVESYGPYAVVFARSEEAARYASTVAAVLVGFGARGVYHKLQLRGDRRRADALVAAPRAPIAGQPAPEPLVVREGPVQFLVRLGDGHHTGLFLDQRDNRARVRQMAEGRSMLNLFCYTGSFTMAAAAGGARSTLSVDLSKRVLGRLLENLDLNGFDPAAHARIADDVVPWLARAARKGQVYDLVVLDPPSFGTRGKKTFSVERDYGRLAADALRVVAPKGSLLAVTNHQGTSPERFVSLLKEAARDAGRAVAHIEGVPMPGDFPHRPEGRVPTKSVLLTLA